MIVASIIDTCVHCRLIDALRNLVPFNLKAKIKGVIEVLYRMMGINDGKCMHWNLFCIRCGEQ